MSLFRFYLCSPTLCRLSYSALFYHLYIYYTYIYIIFSLSLSIYLCQTVCLDDILHHPLTRMNHQQENHGFWPTPLFTPGLKQAQRFMSGMTGFGPSAWEKQFQFTKQRQAQMMLMGQQRNRRITQASPLDMDMPISPRSPIRMTSPRK